MTTTAGHSFYIGPIGSFYNQVNDTGSWEPLVFLNVIFCFETDNSMQHIFYFTPFLWLLLRIQLLFFLFHVLLMVFFLYGFYTTTKMLLSYYVMVVVFFSSDVDGFFFNNFLGKSLSEICIVLLCNYYDLSFLT
jgi:hypothetical protein